MYELKLSKSEWSVVNRSQLSYWTPQWIEDCAVSKLLVLRELMPRAIWEEIWSNPHLKTGRQVLSRIQQSGAIVTIDMYCDLFGTLTDDTKLYMNTTSTVLRNPLLYFLTFYEPKLKKAEAKRYARKLLPKFASEDSKSTFSKRFVYICTTSPHKIDTKPLDIVKLLFK